MDKKICKYICPICRNINADSEKYCTKCGHWMLDVTFRAKAISVSSADMASNIVYGMIVFLLFLNFFIFCICEASRISAYSKRISVNNKAISVVLLTALIAMDFLILLNL